MKDKYRLLKLQEDLENGIIKESDISEDDLDKLDALYIEQGNLFHDKTKVDKTRKDSKNRLKKFKK